jgi:hypothetical protein
MLVVGPIASLERRMVRPSRILGTLAVSLFARLAAADEPTGAREPRLMSESAEVTTVADAFDKDDPFDLNLVVGFRQSWKHANIRRETVSSSGFITANQDIATYSSATSTLLVGADVGLYHDLALILRVPVILSYSQGLQNLGGSSASAAQLLLDPSDPMGHSLFSVPFTSPTRSGVDYISAGLDWGIFNQQRDPTKPTWVIGVEGRLAVGTPLHACNAGGTPQCPDPASPTGPSRDPGISRGMDAIVARSVWSRRYGYVEPYTGITVQAEFPQDRSDFGKWNVPNVLDRSPPVLGSITIGTEVVPYEQREQFQRLSADFRFVGTYHSPGRDYSELFDALGSSPAQSLRTPNPASYVPAGPQGQSIADTNGERVFFSGITEEQAYGSFTASASATWQAGAYVKFTIGGSFSYAQSHLATAADPCNPNNSSLAFAGPCVNANTHVVQGSPNPDHRDIIDSPGHRFSIDDTTTIDLWVLGAVMF